MSMELVNSLLPDLRELQTELVLLSGGEPLLHPEWESIAESLRANGQKIWLLTSGLSLAKHARRAAGLFDAITVSLDGTDPQTYTAIRGLDAFDKVCEGIRAAAMHGRAVGIRVTLQRANFRQLPAFVDLAKQLGAASVSFLAVDVANPHAFGRSEAVGSQLALGPEDLPELEQLLDSLQRTHAEDFRRNFIAENPEKLRRVLQYFRALQGKGNYPEVRCNAPEFSAVMGATGIVQPCFFIGPPAGASMKSNLAGTVNGDELVALRQDIRAGRRAECKTCVCSAWREPVAPHQATNPARFALL
jgi:MoaA/NifB/PqqE/SkfB family radical SAM enzyme